MRIYDEPLTDVNRYIESHKHVKLEDKEREFQYYLGQIRKFKDVTPDTRILEVGTGTGWFPIMCAQKGLCCRGLEISPQLVEYAREFGRRYGIEPDIQVGDVEGADLGTEQYDVIVAFSVFEHVERWREGVRRLFDALKPGGLFYFHSTNKFSLRSGEYHFPLYGWLPDFLRYRLRIARQGPDIMKLGIDFHQFTYFQLRRFFRGLGFSKVFDRFDIIGPDDLTDPKPWKKALLKLFRRVRPLKETALLFVSGTTFICRK